MSFKRDGDDGSQLNLLKKRRVAELLAKDVPDDEAMLMSNGRYACTVCHYKPVFDTVDMLTVHRAGKKHQHATENHFAKKRELALLVQKRRMEAEFKKDSLTNRHKEEEPSPLLQKVEAAKRHTLLKEAPYNPCHTHKMEGPSKKSKGKLFFQGIRQISLKNTSGITINHIAQDSNATNQQRVLSHQSSESGMTSVAAQETPTPGFLNVHTHNPKDNSASPHRNIGTKPDYKSTSRTPAPGVSSIQIKPYIPKAKRTATSSKVCPPKQPGPEPTEEKHVSTSSPAVHQPSSLSMQSPVHREEVRHSSIEFIREFHNTDDECVKNTGTSDTTISPIAHEMRNNRVKDKNLKFAIATIHQKQCLNVNKQKDTHIDDGEREEKKDKGMGSALDGQKGRAGEHRKETSATKGHDDNVRMHPGTSDQQTGLSRSGLTHPLQDVRGFSHCTKGASHKLQDDRGFLQCKEGAKVHEDKTKSRTQKTQQKDKSKMTAEKRKELQRYLELTSAGWVQDNGGHWVKDDDVEFDSDEETPIP